MKTFTLTAEQKNQVRKNKQLLDNAEATHKAARKTHQDYLATIAGVKPGAVSPLHSFQLTDDGSTLVAS